MTRAIGVLAMALAVSMAGCQSAGMQSANNGGMNENSAMNSTDPTAGRTADQAVEGDPVSANNAMPESNMQQMTNQQFVDAAAAGGMYEIQEGKMAESKGATGHLRAVAKRLVADHTRLAKDLARIAKKEGLTLPSEVTPDLQAKITKLEGMSGMDFDREYLTQQQQAHRETIAKFEEEVKTGKSAALRDFAAKALPTLKVHLMLVTQKDEGSSLKSQ